MTKARLITIKSTYHQIVNEPATQDSVRSVVDVESDELPYVRRLSVGEEWVPLEPGWVESVLLVSIHHDAGVIVPLDATPDQVKALTERIVQVGTRDEIGVVRAAFGVLRDHSSEFAPLGGVRDLFVRFTAGTGKVTIRVYPR